MKRISIITEPNILPNQSNAGDAALDLSSLPIFIDGSDGSLWLARDAWEIILANPGSPDVLAQSRFVRVSDLLNLLSASGIKVICSADDKKSTT